MKATPPLGPGMACRRLRAGDADVVWLRAVVEAYDGLATLYGDGSGVVELITTRSRLEELDALIDELCREAMLQRL